MKSPQEESQRRPAHLREAAESPSPPPSTVEMGSGSSPEPGPCSWRHLVVESLPDLTCTLLQAQAHTCSLLHTHTHTRHHHLECPERHGMSTQPLPWYVDHCHKDTHSPFHLKRNRSVILARELRPQTFCSAIPLPQVPSTLVLPTRRETGHQHEEALDSLWVAGVCL